MDKFKISASKGQKKYSLVLTAASEKEAKERVHSEWYSILSIKEITEAEISWNKFIFEWIVNGKHKKWVIIWNDIFKVYVKLKDDLWYMLSALYPESDQGLNSEEKTKILQSLHEGYTHMWKKGKQEQKRTSKQNYTEAKSLDGFHMKKELDETYILIDIVLEKLQGLIINPKNNIDNEKKQKLSDVYNNIVKIKKSTNIEKLKQVWEVALLKIWEIELQALESSKNQESKKLLSQTNKLLKQVWSNEQFKEKNKDINYIFSLFVSDLKEKLDIAKSTKSILKEKNSKKLIDKDSYSFLKTLLLLDKYKKRLKQNNKDISKNLISITLPFGKNKDIGEKILLKRRVIKQNISLLKAKKSWKIISYTGVIKGYKKIIEKTISLIRIFDSYIFYVVVSYSILFILYINMAHFGYGFSWYDFNYTGIFYFIFILSAFILTSISRGIFVLSLNFVILFFILIFWVVNF